MNSNANFNCNADFRRDIAMSNRMNPLNFPKIYDLPTLPAPFPYPHLIHGNSMHLENGQKRFTHHNQLMESANFYPIKGFDPYFSNFIYPLIQRQNEYSTCYAAHPFFPYNFSSNRSCPNFPFYVGTLSHGKEACGVPAYPSPIGDKSGFRKEVCVPPKNFYGKSKGIRGCEGLVMKQLEASTKPLTSDTAVKFSIDSLLGLKTSLISKTSLNPNSKASDIHVKDDTISLQGLQKENSKTEVHSQSGSEKCRIDFNFNLSKLIEIVDLNSQIHTSNPFVQTGQPKVRIQKGGSRKHSNLLCKKGNRFTKCNKLALINKNKGEPSHKSPNKHLCIFCGKYYSRRYGLKIHLRTHTGYKPLKCKYCDRTFGDPSNLNKHIRLHLSTFERKI